MIFTQMVAADVSTFDRAGVVTCGRGVLNFLLEKTVENFWEEQASNPVIQFY